MVGTSPGWAVRRCVRPGRGGLVGQPTFIRAQKISPAQVRSNRGEPPRRSAAAAVRTGAGWAAKLLRGCWEWEPGMSRRVSETGVSRPVVRAAAPAPPRNGRPSRALRPRRRGRTNLRARRTGAPLHQPVRIRGYKEGSCTGLEGRIGCRESRGTPRAVLG